jgi:Cell wall synthesis protein CwsA
MATKTDTPLTTRLTPAQRLNRGLTRTLSGPVDVARGVLGLGAQAASTAASGIGGRVRARFRHDLADAQNALRHELTAAQEAVANLPQTLAEVRSEHRGKPRIRTLVAAAGVILASGAAVFSALRRTVRPPEPSPLPPSVDVEPRP